MPIYKTDKKKNGLQGYRVRINYTDSNGKHRQIERTVYGKAEAQDAERRLLEEAGQSPAADCHYTINKLSEEYLSFKEHEIRKTSWNKNKDALRLYILPHLGGLELSSLSVSDLADWKTKMNQSDLSFTTKKNAYSYLRALLNYAVRMERLVKNPLVSIGNFKEVYFEKPAEKLHYYTPEEFTKYIEAAESTCKTMLDWGCYTFFAIAYYTGMRKGEINALRWSDLEGSTLHIRRSVAQKIKGESIVETPPKNKSSYRDIGIPEPLLSILDDHKKRQQKDSRWTDAYRICGGPSCIADSTISRANNIYASLAQLHHIRVHDFRHSHASLLANNGINIQEIARRLGHSDVQQTWNTYSHLYPKEEERALIILNKVSFHSTPEG